MEMTPNSSWMEHLPTKLHLWIDPIARDGYTNMAADELLTLRTEAWLRLYDWRLPAVSYGHFDTREEAQHLFPPRTGEEVEYIRRWTGGGIVDHRKGQTYTITLPSKEGVMYPSSHDLYLWIHGALAHALQEHGVDCQLLRSDAPDAGRACWASPVESDIVNPAGLKLAGAGQRRFRGAVLHQGLIQECAPSEDWIHALAQHLCDDVVITVDEEPFDGFKQQLDALVASKYHSAAWRDESRGRRPSAKA